MFDPDRIVFLNDVLFCANDVLRLALHQADLACGLDLMFNYWHGWLFYDFWWGGRAAAGCAAACRCFHPAACMHATAAGSHCMTVTRATALLHAAG